MARSPVIHIWPDRRALAEAVANRIVCLAGTAPAARGRFTVALSGGSLAADVLPVFATDPYRSAIDWSSWFVFWVDERCVPLTDTESNFGAAWHYLFRHVPIPADHLFTIDGHSSVSDEAVAYEKKLKSVFHPAEGAFPAFDLVLLGLGPDGHTASLFPDCPALDVTDRWVVPVLNAPKPPPERITLTIPVINHAKHVIFIAAGTGKALIVSRVLEPGETQPVLPAQRVQPDSGHLEWFIDHDAAALLKGDNHE